MSMKNIIYLVCSLVAIFFTASCNLFCTGKKINFGLIYANANDSIQITVDNKVVAQKIVKNDLLGNFGDKKNRLAVVCLTKDSVLVSISINERDTSFYLHPKKIKECYVGSTIRKIIKVYINYEIGGLGDNSPFR